MVTVQFRTNVKTFFSYWDILSVESQKGINAAQRCSVENQKGAIAIDFVLR